MKIFKNKHKLYNEIINDKFISFVPTMGGLHKGHISLIKKSKKFKGKILVSIFVNPKQFDKKKDFNNYYRNIKKDLKVLKKLNIDYVYLPNIKDIFSFRTKNKVYLDKFSNKLCGKFRIGHFKGVVDVINRFLEIIKPKFIFLGIKDFQQLYLIKKHILKRKIPTKVISCKIVREKNGIACSTRNKNLNQKHLKIASKIYKYLSKVKRGSYKKVSNIKGDIMNFGVKKIDYLEFYNLKTLNKSNKINKNNKIFIAYYLGHTRLIDNI
ncbi:MAG: pantoate--beta-alanine ligase [Candidatus Pelagibacter sp. TMED153]|nr:MAG: pantoate--beta-alanine ligase [Candidatus Pelagibacter sp. TMED153]